MYKIKSLRITLLGFIFVFSSPDLHSQNLVPNPGFEKWKQEIKNWSNTHVAFNQAIVDWYSPNEGSPDIFQIKYIGKFILKRPKINMSQNATRTGKGMIGLKLYGCEDDEHCKEYVQVCSSKVESADAKRSEILYRILGKGS